jgi:hypothetical protein
MAVVVVGAGLAGCSNRASSGTGMGPLAHRSAIAPVSIQTACQYTHLRAHVTAGGGEASQPFVVIAVTNKGPNCVVEGYPLIAAALGHTLTGAVRVVPISVVDGSDYEHRDPGPHPLILKRGTSVSFDVGTNTASGTVYTISELEVTLPGGSSPLDVSVHTGGSAFAGLPIQLVVTAFVSGSAGPPAE